MLNRMWFWGVLNLMLAGLFYLATPFAAIPGLVMAAVCFAWYLTYK